MKDNRRKGIDRYGRNFPDKVVLKNGDVLIGQAAVENIQPDGGYSIAYFKVIENLEEWKENKIQFGTKKISIDGNQIEEISTFRDY